MKVIAVVGFHKTGKTTLAASLITSLSKHGRVGSIKHMPGHDVDSGDTRRHFEAGAEVVYGLGLAQIRISRGGDLKSMLEDLEKSGMDFVVVEGFKSSNLKKIAVGGIDVENTVYKVDLSELDESRIADLTSLILSLEDVDIGCMDDGSEALN